VEGEFMNTSESTVSVVIPAYNEEKGVGPEVKAIRQVLSS
jgi:glycosyltransferase involved in cell wall biosynthesis